MRLDQGAIYQSGRQGGERGGGGGGDLGEAKGAGPESEINQNIRSAGSPTTHDQLN